MSRAWHWPIGFAALVLAACQTAESPEPATPSNPAQQSSPGKVSAPVEITYELLGEPRLGQPLTIQVTTRALRPTSTRKRSCA